MWMILLSGASIGAAITWLLLQWLRPIYARWAAPLQSAERPAWVGVQARLQLRSCRVLWRARQALAKKNAPSRSWGRG